MTHQEQLRHEEKVASDMDHSLDVAEVEENEEHDRKIENGSEKGVWERCKQAFNLEDLRRYDRDEFAWVECSKWPQRDPANLFVDWDHEDFSHFDWQDCWEKRAPVPQNDHHKNGQGKYGSKSKASGLVGFIAWGNVFNDEANEVGRSDAKKFWETRVDDWTPEFRLESAK